MLNLLPALMSVAMLWTIAPSTLKYDAPPGWISKPAGSTMRVAEFSLPKVQGDAEDGGLTIYFFGAQGGTVEANLDRWMQQMAQPDGSSSKAAAKTTKLTSHGLPVTLVDITGTYVAETSPGAAEHFNKPGFRLRAAVVEVAGGNYYVKLIGPEKTITKWDASFMAFLKTLRVAE